MSFVRSFFRVALVSCLSVLGTAALLPATARAELDTAKPFLCAVIEVHECLPSSGCAIVPPDVIGAPGFFSVDVANKLITNADLNGTGRKTEIKAVTELGGNLFLQGAEKALERQRDALGWTAAIARQSGEMTLSASSDQIAFLIFGRCTQN
jgi:hypothetical protein